jgi:hypothetical protein
MQRVIGTAIPFILALVLMSESIANASTTTTYDDSLSGVEYYATPTLGAFTGTASGDLPGTFDTQVQHTPLTTTATITGGSFTLYTIIGNALATVSGQFKDGLVTQTDKMKGGCRNQHYAVTGALQNVGVGGAGTGTGSFDATLTHYRVRVGRECITYFATIAGTVSLIF